MLMLERKMVSRRLLRVLGLERQSGRVRLELGLGLVREAMCGVVHRVHQIAEVAPTPDLVVHQKDR
jgi:hypothetical protein